MFRINIECYRYKGRIIFRLCILSFTKNNLKTSRCIIMKSFKMNNFKLNFPATWEVWKLKTFHYKASGNTRKTTKNLWEMYCINPFSTNVPLVYPLKTSEKLRFSDVFRGYTSGTLVENGLLLYRLHFTFKLSQIGSSVQLRNRCQISCLILSEFKRIN